MKIFWNFVAQKFEKKSKTILDFFCSICVLNTNAIHKKIASLIENLEKQIFVFFVWKLAGEFCASCGYLDSMHIKI